MEAIIMNTIKKHVANQEITNSMPRDEQGNLIRRNIGWVQDGVIYDVDELSDGIKYKGKELVISTLTIKDMKHLIKVYMSDEELFQAINESERTGEYLYVDPLEQDGILLTEACIEKYISVDKSAMLMKILGTNHNNNLDIILEIQENGMIKVINKEKLQK